MKIITPVLVVVLLGAGIASAQTSPTVSAAPDIIVIQQSWHLYARNSSLDADPFSANTEFTDAIRAQRINDIQNAARAKAGESREPPPPRPNRPHGDFSTPVMTYAYSAKIKNTGTRTIQTVDWGYIFVDPETHTELGRHRQLSKVKIRRNQNNNLVTYSASPPASIVNVKNAGKEVSKQLIEQIVIYRIVYDDGSVWANPTQ